MGDEERSDESPTSHMSSAEPPKWPIVFRDREGGDLAVNFPLLIGKTAKLNTHLLMF